MFISGQFNPEMGTLNPKFASVRFWPPVWKPAWTQSCRDIHVRAYIRLSGGGGGVHCFIVLHGDV